MHSAGNILVSLILLSVNLLPWASSFTVISNHPENSTNTSSAEMPTKSSLLFHSQETLTSSEEDAFDYSETDYSAECSVEEFWHIRGKRCVPFKCPRANWMRDWKTGECLHILTETGGLKSFASGHLGRTAFKMRSVLKPMKRVIMRGRGAHLGTKWQGVTQKHKITLDENVDTLIRTPYIVG